MRRTRCDGDDGDGGDDRAPRAKRARFALPPFERAATDDVERAQRIRSMMLPLVRAPLASREGRRLGDARRLHIDVGRTAERRLVSFEECYRTVYEAVLMGQGHVWHTIRAEMMPLLAAEHARKGERDAYDFKVLLLCDISLYAENTWVRITKSEGTRALATRLWDTYYSKPGWRARHLLWGMLMKRCRIKLCALALFLVRCEELTHRPFKSGYQRTQQALTHKCPCA